MRDRDFRRLALRALGASSSTIDELIEYNENVFDLSAARDAVDDEPFVSAWDAYAIEAGTLGAYACLRDKLIQLRFPIKEGISATVEYRAATRQGTQPLNDRGPELGHEEGIDIEIHATACGRIPLIIAPARSDFVALVCALARKNEPVAIPASMGACLVAGFINWDRVRRYQLTWESDHPHERWADEFRHFSKEKHLYQDSFVILTEGPYSGVPEWEMGLSTDAWRAISMVIRREHECTHYYTRRVLGSMRRNLLDEIIADYMGICGAMGCFRADWFLRFMGLESYPAYRSGGRFENYVGNLSESAMAVLARLVVLAAENLEYNGPVCRGISASPSEKVHLLGRLTSLTLEEMACDDIRRTCRGSAQQASIPNKLTNFTSGL